MKIRNNIQQPVQDILSFLSESDGNNAVETAGHIPATISSAAGLDSPDLNSECLTFLRASEVLKSERTVATSKAKVFLISISTPPFPVAEGKFIIKVKNPQLSFIAILEKFFLDKEEQFLPKDIHPTAIIAASAKIDKSAKIGAYAVIGENVEISANVILHPHVVLYHDVKIGENSVLHSHCVVREHTIIGKHCVIQPGAVLAADGFGYVLDPSFGLKSAPQIGSLEIKDRVDVGANTCVDRATSGKTLIGSGSKLDNLVQVGHNVQIGSNSILCGQVAVGGSAEISDGVVLGGQVGIGDHIKICKGVRVGGGSAVTEHIEEPGDYTGTSPITPAFAWRRIATAQRYLPEIYKSWKKSSKKSE